jgi:predicted dehydrogenase
MKPIKLGIIGCGIATKELHWPALKEIKDKFEITVVCNHTEGKAKEFAQMAGNVPYVLDYRKVLEMPDVEAVSIVLPIELNYLVTADAVKAGKHVIVEKPLAANLDEAKLMLELEKNNPKVLMVAENFRYRKIFQQLKYLIEQGKIGDVYSVFWNWFDFVDPNNNKYAQTKWRVHHKYPGGFVVDGGVHSIAAMREVFGEIYNISTFAGSVNKEIGEIDTLSLQFSTPKNVLGVINLFFSSNSYEENQVVVLGNKGSIIIDREQLTVKINNKVESTEQFVNDNGFKGEFEDFYSAIRLNQKVKSTFFEAYCDLKVLIDALGSSVTKQK